MRSFKPHVTVATIVENEGQYLLVEEYDRDQIVYNQPAGHLESGESLVEAAIRETLEETAWEVEVTDLLGIDLYTAPINKETYFRTTFVAEAIKLYPERPLDKGIIRAHWLSIDDIKQRSKQLRSPLVLDTIRRYESGCRYSLSVLGEL